MLNSANLNRFGRASTIFYSSIFYWKRDAAYSNVKPFGLYYHLQNMHTHTLTVSKWSFSFYPRSKQRHYNRDCSTIRLYNLCTFFSSCPAQNSTNFRGRTNPATFYNNWVCRHFISLFRPNAQIQMQSITDE